jgi:peroxiredoxin Q/BCP
VAGGGLPNANLRARRFFMRFRLLPTLAAAVLMAGTGWAEDAQVNLKVGNKAPTFTGTDQDGKAYKSSDHVGKKYLVVYFFPAAFTGG